MDEANQKTSSLEIATKELQHIEARRTSDEGVDAVIRFHTAVYDNAARYSNLMIVAGYAGCFALWSQSKDSMPEYYQACAGLLLVMSGMIFVAFEIIKMVSMRLNLNKVYPAIESKKDVIEKVIIIEQVNRDYQLRFSSYWKYYFVPTVVLASISALMLCAWYIYVICCSVLL